MATQSLEEMPVTLGVQEETAEDIVSADPPSNVDLSLEATSKSKAPTNKDSTEQEVDEYKEPQFDEIISFLEGESNLDIYQLTAFRVQFGAGCCSKQHRLTGQVIPVLIDEDDCSCDEHDGDENEKPPTLELEAGAGHNDKGDDKDEDKDDDKDDEEDAMCHLCGYWMDIFKAVICAFTQFSSIVVLYLEVEDLKAAALEELGKDTWCDSTAQWKPKLMAISYSFFLSLIMWLNYTNQTVGFYRFVDYREHEHSFISSNWLHLGKLINAVLVLNVFYLSFFVVFFSTDPLDIILNCVALLFLVDIDNMVIDGADYQKTLTWFKNAENLKRVTHTPMKPWWKALWTVIRCVIGVVTALTMMGVVAVPFVVAVCY